ncbi:transposase [Thiotrichales bacterium HSG14]|nr:transposase [Thiotrichales bacterium HSG14]
MGKRYKYHDSKAVKKFMAEKINRLTVYKLPAYSPDFNPIEKVWKKIKEFDPHLHYFPTFDSLKLRVDSALTNFGILSKLGGIFHNKTDTQE